MVVPTQAMYLDRLEIKALASMICRKFPVHKSNVLVKDNKETQTFLLILIYHQILITKLTEVFSKFCLVERKVNPYLLLRNWLKCQVVKRNLKLNFISKMMRKKKTTSNLLVKYWMMISSSNWRSSYLSQEIHLTVIVWVVSTETWDTTKDLADLKIILVERMQT